MKKSTLLIAVAVASIAMPSAAQTVSAEPEPYRLKLGEWSKLKHNDRMIIIIGAIEGLLLAVQAPDAGRAPINDQCLVSDSPAGIETKLLKLKDSYKGEAFVDIFLVATNCLEPAA